MVNPTDENQLFEQLQKARQAAIQINAAEPRAISATYDASKQLIVVQLKSGALFSFPPDIAQGLAGAAAEDLAKVEVTSSGSGLHWEALDADFTVSGLLAGVFGTKAWMARLQERWQQQQAS
ncbi:MAG: DUF2442 domain-containing protein [Cyanothece sp. SIO1E1]|nr:DUF2442 domain-containing protein [Cyanothece sp. SIO1E1]